MYFFFVGSCRQTLGCPAHSLGCHPPSPVYLLILYTKACCLCLSLNEAISGPGVGSRLQSRLHILYPGIAAPSPWEFLKHSCTELHSVGLRIASSVPGAGGRDEMQPFFFFPRGSCYNSQYSKYSLQYSIGILSSKKPHPLLRELSA